MADIVIEPIVERILILFIDKHLLLTKFLMKLLNH